MNPDGQPLPSDSAAQPVFFDKLMNWQVSAYSNWSNSFRAEEGVRKWRRCRIDNAVHAAIHFENMPTAASILIAAGGLRRAGAIRYAIRRQTPSRVGKAMFLKKIDGPRVVMLPDGRSLSRTDLPASTTLRWVPQRKKAVAEAVQAGLISRQDAKRTYELSDLELDAWCCEYPLGLANGDACCKNAPA